MSAFFDVVDEILSNTEKSDRSIPIATCMEFDFESTPVLLWSGHGTMITPDGLRWVGTHNGDAQSPRSFVSVPNISDVRGGSSPLLTFTLGYLDSENYNRIRDNNEDVRGRLVTISNVVMPRVGLRSISDRGNFTRLRMLSSQFSEKREKLPTGEHRQMNSISVTAKNSNAGRSKANFGTYNDVGQVFRSEALFGIQNDEYCRFTAKPLDLVVG